MTALTHPDPVQASPSESLPYAWRKVVHFANNMAQAKVGDAIGRSPKQQLTWIGLAALPLLLPFGIPGVATTLGYLTCLLGLGYAAGYGVPIPRWLAEKRLPPKAAQVLHRILYAFIRRVGRRSRPRFYLMSHRRMRPLNGLMLAFAGLTMAAPVPFASFDNVLPAAAMVCITFGLRVRDGALVLAGYGFAVLAALLVLGLWWGGYALFVWAMAQPWAAQWLGWLFS
ncbi:MAG TPA: exopolysaccharide biosynthesis protein [Limnobacter sp.]|nr:exopolysaccharide biosynthesis protein [Limnobacter sp.]